MTEISEFSTTFPYTSKIRPEVSFVIRRLNLIGRIERDAMITEEVIEYNNIVDDMEGLKEELKKSEPPNRVTVNKLKSLNARLELIYYTKIVPSRIKASLVSVSGIVGEDKKPLANPHDILSLPPDFDDLIAELYGACNAAAEKNTEELKNWQRPGTLPKPAMPEAATTIADTASENSNTSPETVLDTSPAKSIAA